MFKDKTKLKNIVVTVALASVLGAGRAEQTTAQLGELGDSNPFVNRASHNNAPSSAVEGIAEGIAEGIVEPKGAAVVSFSQQANAITDLNADRQYVAVAKQTNDLGYATVHPSRVRDFNQLVNQYRSHDAQFRSQIRRQISGHKGDFLNGVSPLAQRYAFSVADLDSVIMNKTDVLLEAPNGNFVKGQGWDSLTRIIRHQTFGLMVVDEWDFSLSDGGVILDKDAVNFYVNGHAGVLIIRAADNGAAETVLSWVDKKKAYTIQVNKNINAEGLMAQFKALVESMSAPTFPMER